MAKVVTRGEQLDGSSADIGAPLAETKTPVDVVLNAFIEG